MPKPGPVLFPSPTLLPGSSTFTDGVSASLAPWADEANAWQTLNAAYAEMFEAVAQIVMDQGSPDEPAAYVAGWSALLDPDNCPTAYLPFLSMFNGTGVPPGTDDADARAIIQAEAGFARGTPAAMIATAQRFLTGTQSCVLIERTPDAYSCSMVCRPEEAPNQAALEAAVLAVKPAGIVIAFVFTDSFIWNAAIHTFSADTFSWNATNSTQP